MKKRYIYLILSLLMTIFIFTNSLMPADVSSNQSGFFLNFTNKMLLRFNLVVEEETLSFIVRKTAHLTQFFFWGMFFFLFISTFKKEEYEFYFQTLYCGLIIALTDEIIQHFIPGRSMQPSDVLIDISGVLIFLVLAYILRMIVWRIKYKK